VRWDEPEQAPPWRSDQGEPPVVWVWPHSRGSGPTLRARINGRWVAVTVESLARYPDGRLVYNVAVPLPGRPGDTHRSYRYPQDGLRLVARAPAPPVRADSPPE
jgi:hypothetical protein